jgi:hypothetical protein
VSEKTERSVFTYGHGGVNGVFAFIDHHKSVVAIQEVLRPGTVLRSCGGGRLQETEKIKAAALERATTAALH